MPKRYPPDDPREWLNRARNNLAQAKTKRKDVYLEDLCFHAQQAAEKAIKALLINDAATNRFPNYKHNAVELRQLKAELYKLLLPAVGKERMVEVAERILKLQRQ